MGAVVLIASWMDGDDKEDENDVWVIRRTFVPAIRHRGQRDGGRKGSKRPEEGK